MKESKLGIMPFTTAWIAVIIALTAGHAGGQKDGMSADGLSTPLEYYPGGNIKVRLTAKAAKVESGGDRITGTGVVYEVFAEDGRTNACVRADDCIYTKANGMAESESNVRVEKDGAVITGRGFSLDSKRERVLIKNEVRVVLPKGFKIKREPEAKNVE